MTKGEINCNVRLAKVMAENRQLATLAQLKDRQLAELAQLNSREAQVHGINYRVGVADEHGVEGGQDHYHGNQDWGDGHGNWTGSDRWQGNWRVTPRQWVTWGPGWSRLFNLRSYLPGLGTQGGIGGLRGAWDVQVQDGGGWRRIAWTDGNASRWDICGLLRTVSPSAQVYVASWDRSLYNIVERYQGSLYSVLSQMGC